jgi:hypothetical protein
MALPGNKPIGYTGNKKCICEKKNIKEYSTACSPFPFKQEA